MKLSRFGLGIAALFATVLAASAAGMFNNLPVVGSSSTAYCALYAGDGTTCSAYVPAGPTSLSGNELFAADTQLSGGASPQTVRIKPASIGAGPTQYSAPLTGTSITILPTTRQVVIEPAGTLAALTIVTPAASAMVDGQRIGFCTTQIVTTLTVTAGAGVTVKNAPTAMLVPVATGAASCVEWMYVAAQTALYRVQ